MEALLTTEEVAAILRTTARNVLRLADQHEIPSVQRIEGGAVTFERVDVAKYIKQHKRGATG